MGFDYKQLLLNHKYNTGHTLNVGLLGFALAWIRHRSSVQSFISDNDDRQIAHKLHYRKVEELVNRPTSRTFQI